MEEDDGKFLMVVQRNWEDDIIWDAATVRPRRSRLNESTWVPTSQIRVHQSPSAKLPSSLSLQSPSCQKDTPLPYEEGGKITELQSSLLPVENPELVFGRWEDKIIWDASTLTDFEPSVPIYDAGDENFLMNIPPDVQQIEIKKVKLNNNHSKMTKNILSSFGIIKDMESTEEEKLDPYNISNDKYYQSEKSQGSFGLYTGKPTYCHSEPVKALHEFLFPTTSFAYYGLKSYHRPLVRLLPNHLYEFDTVDKFQKRIAKLKEMRKFQREKKKLSEEDFSICRSPIETISELSGREGDIILVEYCEEFPPLLSQIGMHSEIKNFINRSNRGLMSQFKYGELDIVRENTFLGQLGNTQVLQSLENNLYRCPIYQHDVTFNFLVIRVGHDLFVREINGLFTAGQQCPLDIVPPPNSLMQAAFTKEFLMVVICRLLHKSTSQPKVVYMSDIKEAFPSISESSIRKVLKTVADFERAGSNNSVWKMKSAPDFDLPPKSKLCEILAPEKYCVHYSAAAAESRLKLAGYKEKHFLLKMKPGEEQANYGNDANTVDEMKCAPWNTTKAFVSALRGKCRLEIKGAADPTGCAEGFSYVRIPNRPMVSDTERKKLVNGINGTESDLRKLGLDNAKKILLQFGVPERRLKKLTRWEIVDIVRTLSTEKAKAGQQGLNFSRINPCSIAEYQRKNSEDGQHAFDLQNQLLSSKEVLSSDESGGEDSDIEDMGKQLEDIISKNKSRFQIEKESEERERGRLINMLMKERENAQPGERKSRVLKIHRTYNTPDGSITETEIVNNQDVIDIYCKIHKMGSNPERVLLNGVLKKGADRLKAIERRLLVDRKRRLTSKEGKVKIKKPKIVKPPMKEGFAKQCSACKQFGHLKTNSYCPKYPTRPKWVSIVKTPERPLVMKFKLHHRLPKSKLD